MSRRRNLFATAARSAGWGALGLALMTNASSEAAAQQAVDRAVIALSAATSETNLKWLGFAQHGLDAAMQLLVGNDPVTGQYDTSGLARAWEVNDDFTEWRFFLHENAEFHNGWGPVTAADVVHSYELHTGPDSTLTDLAQLKAKEVVAEDDHTVVFRFDEPRLDYLFVHAGRGAMFVYSKAQFDAEGLDGYERQPAGTGPYRYVERTMGEGILFERVEDHWQGTTPDFAELYMRYIPEDGTKLAALLAGEAHITLLPSEIQQEALDQGMEMIYSQRPSKQTIVNFNGMYATTGDPAFNPDLPWHDIRIREAMNRAVNRDELLEILYGDAASTLARYGMLEGHEGYTPALQDRFEEMYGHDPERARELIAEAGYPDAFGAPVIPIVCYTRPSDPEFGLVSEALQIYFEGVGLQTEIRDMDHAAMGALGRDREAYVLSCTRNSPIRPTEAHLINSYTPEGSQFHGYEDDHIVALVDKLTDTIEPKARDQIASEAFTYLFEQYSDLPLAEVPMGVTVNPEIIGGWTFPGVTSVGLGHWHLIEAAE